VRGGVSEYIVEGFGGILEFFVWCLGYFGGCG